MVVKLKFFKTLRTNSAFMKWFSGAFSSEYGPILPIFSPEVADKKVWIFFEGFKFFEGFNFDPPFSTGDYLNRKKCIYLLGITWATGLSKYVKVKALSPLPILWKERSLFALFGLFWAGNSAGSQVNWSELEFNISYPPTLFLVNFQHFPVLRL